ncbi:MAG TPA: DUF1080 domain-containing protein [Gemmataceae bacterium]|jgi:hypothetical protein|nr:DUF1080 domain-containing protein [Gemmataceae bacterium]
MRKRKVIGGGLVAIVSVCGTLAVPAADGPAKTKDAWKSLFDGKTLAGWKAADYRDGGKVFVKDGIIVMEKGSTMTGIVYTGKDFPKMDYEVSFEGQRLAGGDFFCTTVFPVGSEFCSFVTGGWGGTIVGLSNINSENASANITTTTKDFDNGKWYKFRLRVTKDRIRSWIGEDRVVDLDTVDRRIALHSSCGPCKPFGFATWKTTGAVRAIRVRPLTAEERKPAEDK